MISYYELLGMIKEDKAPKEIRVHLTPETSKIYVRENDLDDTFNCYVISEDEETSEDYKCYLTDCYIESMMFEKNIEIIEEEKKIPEKLNVQLNRDDENKVNCYRATNLECDLAFKINSIIDYLKSKGE